MSEHRHHPERAANANGRPQHAAPSCAQPCGTPAAQPGAYRPVQPGGPSRASGVPPKKNNGGPWRVVFWISIIVFLLALVALGAIMLSYWQGERTYEEVAQEAFEPETLTVDWDALREINPETVGWIYIPGTPVNYPIVQASDDEKYLKNDFRGSQGWIATFGAIFLSADNAPDFSDANNIIYGHHLNDGSMFACLADFGDVAQFNDHRTVYILTPETNFELTTFALVHVAADDPLAQTQFADEEERVGYLQDKIDRSVVGASDIPAAADIEQSFAFATCDNLASDGRYVLYASVTDKELSDTDPELAQAEQAAVEEVQADAAA